MAGRPCTVCTNDQHDEIDRQLLAGVPFRNISERSGMSVGSLFRHRGEHLAEQLASAAEQREAAEPATPSPPTTPSSVPTTPPPTPSPAESPEPSRRQTAAEAIGITEQLKAINAAALAVLRDARVAGDGRLQLLAIDRIQRQLELQAKLLGEIDERPVVNIWLDPAWQTIEQTLVEALRPHPAARFAVVERLNTLRAL